MFSKRFLLVISMICIHSIYGQSANVDSVVVRLSRPSSSSQYLPSDADNYNDGDSITITDLDNVWFLVAISTPQADDKYRITIEGNNGGSDTVTRKFGKSSSGTKFRGHTMDIESLKDAGSTSMTVKCEIIGSSTSSIEITVSISFDGIATTSAPVQDDAKVSDLSVRLSSPGTNINNYVSSNPDNFANGESITIEDLSELVYFVVLFENWSSGMQYKFTIEGNNGGSIDDSGNIESTGKSIGRSMNGFENSNSMTVKCELYDANDNLIVESVKEITIILIFNLDPAFVSHLSVRLLAPQTFDEYKETDSNSLGDGDEIVIHDLDSFVYFPAIFDNWVSGMKYKYNIAGNNGGLISASGDILASAKYIGKSLNGFEASTSMVVTCEILDSNNNLIVGSTKEITIILSFGDITPSVDNLSVRLSSPGQVWDNYLESNPDNFADGQSITITDLNEAVWFLATFTESQSNYNVKFIVSGDNGGFIESDLLSMSGGNAYGTSLFGFTQSSSMTVTCQVLNSQGSVVDSKSAEIGLSFNLSSRRRLGGKYKSVPQSRLLSMNMNMNGNQ